MARKRIVVDTTVLVEWLKERDGDPQADVRVLCLLTLEHDYIIPTLVLGEVLSSFPKR